MFSAIAAVVVVLTQLGAMAIEEEASIDSLGEFVGAHHWTQMKQKCGLTIDRSFDPRLLCYSLLSLPDGLSADIEVLHLSPSIVLFHNVISPSERRQLILAAKNLVRPALIQNSTTQQHHVSDSRVVNGTFLPMEKYPITHRLANIVRSLTGFNVDCAELFNVLFYERGGHYSIHHDALILPTQSWTQALLEEMYTNARNCWEGTASWLLAIDCAYFLVRDVLNKWRSGRLRRFYQQRIDSPTRAQLGNRLATFMFYVDVPSAGGGTLFPQLNLTVNADAGDAILWFNIFPNGTNDYDTIHGACPVVHGSKKVATMWIRQRDQTFSLLCPLERAKAFAVEDFTGRILGQM
uniref:Fe2OG dioxygenase domain-containing protein n=1 Tax=Plectus sambesii TaxID=2011161 RepID=A0A914X137_9BILA